MMSPTDPPKELATVSSNINNDNNSNNLSSSACNSEQSSSNDKPFLTKEIEEHINKKLKKFDFDAINTDNYARKYIDKRLISLSMQQKTVLESRIDLDKQFSKQSVNFQTCKKMLDSVVKLKKELEQKENEGKKKIYEIQAELQRTNQQIEKEDNKLSFLREQYTQIKNETIKLCTDLPKYLDVKTSDKQCDTNHESVVPHLSTSHPSTENALPNDNVVAISSLSMPDLNESNEYHTDSITANLEKIFEEQELVTDYSDQICAENE
ncbi:PREDICTED: uncharacterized protein LOC105456136 [Wasmannia auropunctata]|uniref:uncharacterized protein LOC105456136 n=1 Tax=Wasmannia auropunctata TaxID=64793 RepID=UPI0005EE8209|nr:PREDICTED: uncharacterized protein LOC105456136 [Wasmannia auropunctata]